MPIRWYKWSVEATIQLMVAVPPTLATCGPASVDYIVCIVIWVPRADRQIGFERRGQCWDCYVKLDAKTITLTVTNLSSTWLHFRLTIFSALLSRDFIMLTGSLWIFPKCISHAHQPHGAVEEGCLELDSMMRVRINNVFTSSIPWSHQTPFNLIPHTCVCSIAFTHLPGLVCAPKSVFKRCPKSFTAYAHPLVANSSCGKYKEFHLHCFIIPIPATYMGILTVLSEIGHCKNLFVLLWNDRRIFCYLNPWNSQDLWTLTNVHVSYFSLKSPGGKVEWRED